MSGSVALTAAADDAPAHYALAFEKEFTVEAGDALTHAMANAPLRVTLGMEKKDFKCAALEVDLLDVVLGRTHTVEIAEQVVAGPGVEGPWAPEVTLYGVSLRVLEAGGTEEEPTKEPALVMPAEDGEAVTVLSVESVAAARVPPGMAAAAAKVGEGNCRLLVSAVLPVGPGRRIALQAHAASLDAEAAAMSYAGPPVRYLLPREAVSYLAANLDEGCKIAVEVGRAFPASVKVDDPAEMAYRGVAAVDISALAEPGRERATVACPVTLATADAVGSLGPFFPASTLPGKRPPAEGKDAVKVDDDADGGCPFVAAGTVVSLGLSLSRPLLPPWAAPLAPEIPAEEVVPPRAPPPPRPPRSATDLFRDECRRVAREVSEDYRRLAEGAPEVGVTPAAMMTSRTKLLKYELNRSGKFLAIRATLKSRVQEIVRERYGLGGEMAPEEMSDVYNSLFATLCAEMRLALKELYSPDPATVPPPPGARDREEMLRLADECERVGRPARAEQLHQDRLAGAEDARTWRQYGGFCARRGNARRASEAFKRALELDPADPAARRSLALVLAAMGLQHDPLHLRHAEAVVHSLLPGGGGGGGGADPGGDAGGGGEAAAADWALLAAVLGQARGRERDCRNAGFEARRLAREAGADLDAGFLGGAEAALELGLARVALELLDMTRAGAAAAAWEGVEGEVERVGGVAGAVVGAGDGAGGEAAAEERRALGVRVALARARAHLAARRFQDCLAEAARAAQGARGGDAHRVALLRADAYHGLGRMEAAARHYLAAVSADAPACPPESFLRLADALAARGDGAGALQVLLSACRHAPCSTAWERAGVAFYGAGALDKADGALAQATILDPRNAAAWGYLAAVQQRQGQAAEADTCLRHALKHGLCDARVTVAVAREMTSAGRLDAAAAVLRRTVGVADDPEAHLLLGEVLHEAGDAEAAAESLRAAVASAERALGAAEADAAPGEGARGSEAGGEPAEPAEPDGDSAVARAGLLLARVRGRAGELLGGQ